VFCDIIAGRAEASVVYRDDEWTAVMDICPVNPGHLHVLPRFDGDGFGHTFPPGCGTHPLRHLLDANAASIRRALHAPSRVATSAASDTTRCPPGPVA
jgi:diadenosine tetraphosphate (Ap4A) HIT family hydrolase